VRPISSDALPASHSRPSLLSSPRLSLLIRALLAVLALWLVYLAQTRYSTWQIAYASTFTLQTGLWLGWIGFSALAGLAFGLAAWMPWPLAPIRYRWSGLLLAALAGAPIAEFAYVWGYLPVATPSGGGSRPPRAGSGRPDHCSRSRSSWVLPWRPVSFDGAGIRRHDLTLGSFLRVAPLSAPESRRSTV
jgi:hypothetical protein